jgi:hypothetical protein
MKKIIVAATALLAIQAQAAKWDTSNNPDYFNLIAKTKMKHNLRDLPEAAKLLDDRLGWSETFWPSNLGGIAYRWNSTTPTPFKYESPKKEEILALKSNPAKLEALLSTLSPAELYDISQDDFSYSLTKKVLKNYSPKDLWWEGICHGWSQAAANFAEPDKTVVISKKNQIPVPFGSSDVKGLLAMHEAYNSDGLYTRIGDRCAVEGKVPGEAFPEDGDLPYPSEVDANSRKCADTNAGALHIVLTNMIGVNSQGFVADVDRFNDVWNQPVVGYESVVHYDKEIPVTPAEFKSGIARKVPVSTKMIYGDELEFYSPELASEGVIGFVSKDPVTGTSAQTNGEKLYEYILELDSFDNIVGGEWVSKSRPDMIWMKVPKDKSNPFHDGKFPLKGLKDIYKPVRR